MDSQSLIFPTMTEPLAEDVCPLKYIPTEFINDYNEAREKAGGKVDRLDLVWEVRRPNRNAPETVSYIFRMYINDLVFGLKCRSIEPRKFLLFKNRQTQVEMKMIRVVEGKEEVLKTYDNLIYNNKIDKTTCKFLFYLAMFQKVDFDKVTLQMPRKPYKISNLNIIQTRDLTMSVHRSITDPDFVDSWLHLINVVGIWDLTINSTQLSIAIAMNDCAREQLKKVRHLTINGRADIDTDFLTTFDGSQIIYKETTRQSPITLLEFIRFWQAHKDKTHLRKKYVFTTVHCFYQIEEFQDDIYYEGGEFMQDNGTRRFAAKPDQEFTKTFEMSANKLAGENVSTLSNRQSIREMAARRDDEVLPQPDDDPSVLFATALREAVTREGLGITLSLSKRADIENGFTVDWYEFIMLAGRHKFTIECRPRRIIVPSCCPMAENQEMNLCRTFKKSTGTSDADQIAEVPYGHKEYDVSVETKTCQLLLQYLIEENYQFRDVDLVLPPKEIEFPLRQVAAAGRLTLEVSQAITDEDFLASWLDVIGVSNVERLRLITRFYENNIRPHAVAYNQLISADHLEIIGRTDLDYGFLVAFTGSTLIFSDTGRCNITIIQMAEWWTRQRQETPPQPRRIELRTPQDVRIWDTIKGNVYGGFVPRDAPFGRFEHIGQEQRHLFELTGNHLIVLFANNQ